MATSDSFGQTKVLIRQQSGGAMTGPTTNAVLATSGGTVTLEQGSTFTAAGTVNFASAILTFPGSLSSGYLDLGPHLFNARNAASAETVASGSSAPTAFWGGLLMPDGSPSFGFDSTANRNIRLQWASGNVASVVLPPIAIPQDLSTAGGMTVQLFGESIGTATAADAISAIQMIIRASILSSASGADVGSTHPNFTSTPSWQGVTITSGNMTTNAINVVLTPQAHAGRAINLYGMRASYTKRTS